MHGGPWILGLALACCLLMGCGDGEKGGQGAGGDGGGATAASPSKEAIVDLLRGLLAALEAKDLPKAADYLVAFPGMTPEDAQKGVSKFIERNEISAAGIDILAERGEFGTLKEVYPERGDYFAKKAGVDASKCYALALEPGEVVVFWGGDKPRFIRLDDVGKIR